MMQESTLWDQVLAHLRERLDPEEYRRWLSQTSYASDSGDQVTVWVATESARRFIDTHYRDAIDRAVAAADRAGTRIRFVVAGYEDEHDLE
jgi:chromosomal replication initiation ATPase DnaA